MVGAPEAPPDPALVPGAGHAGAVGIQGPVAGMLLILEIRFFKCQYVM